MAALSHEVDELQATLDRRFRVKETRVDVSSRTFVIRHPANADDLISEEDFVRDDRLPYWADIWPSSRVLAARLLEENGTGRSLVELGCGSGLVSAAAASVGFDVVATDYYEDAMLFARLNANRNAGRDIGTRLLDWRDIAHDVGRFDCVVASDVLYEKTYGALVANVFDRLLAPNGFALMADPGRISRDDFLNSLGPLGLAVTGRVDVPYEEGEIRQTIAIIRIERMIGLDSDRASIDARAGESPPLPNPSDSTMFAMQGSSFLVARRAAALLTVLLARVRGGAGLAAALFFRVSALSLGLSTMSVGACAGSVIDSSTIPHSIVATGPHGIDPHDGLDAETGPVGARIPLQVVALNASGEQISPNGPYVFTSRNPSVLTVDSSGIVTLVAGGVAFVVVALPVGGTNLTDSVFFSVGLPAPQ